MTPRAGDRGDLDGDPPRPRRRGLPDGPQAQPRPAAGGGGQADVRRGERRRVRAGNVQGPRDHAPRPAPVHRGLPDRGARDRVEARLHLHPRRVRWPSSRCSSAAADEVRDAGLLGDVTLVLHRGAGAYICGEESALLESLEGKRGQPRPRPPFPPISGLYASPTLINNVQTLATVPMIIELGGAWYAKIGAPRPRPAPSSTRSPATSSGPGTTSSRSGRRCAS